MQETWIPVLLAVVATALLPVRKRFADAAICALLAGLWAVLALRIADGSLFRFLAIAEAVLLFLLGVTGKIRFEARNGSWAVTGSVILVYALLIFPALRLIGWNDVILGEQLASSFPVLLFTCGVLFFAPGEATGLLLVVPFCWALLGGPEADPSMAALAEMNGSLVTTALFLVLPPYLRGAGDGRPSRAAAYRHAQKNSALFGHGLWLLLLTTLFLFFQPEISAFFPPQLPLNLALLCVVAAILWLIFPAWLSLWYRYVAWWAARYGGMALQGIRGAWQWGIPLLGAAALFIELAARDRSATIKRLLGRSAETDWPLWVLLAIILAWLGYHLYRGSRRLVLGTFTVHAQDDGVGKWASGLGARLENELARIAGIYRVIDEARPSSRADVIEVIPGVGEVGEILAEASSIEIPGAKISAKPLLSLAGRLVSGPRLSGSLHKVNGSLVLMAELTGGGRQGNWRVGLDDLPEDERRLPEEAVVGKLVEQLAFRIATDLVAIGSPRWQAVRLYTEGLRLYREAQRQGEAAPKLREAERRLIQALKDDRQFTQCYFNLGVVYLQLRELESAESAFRLVLRESPDNFDACYALAETLRERKQPRDAFWFSQAALAVGASDARAWDLAAYALRQEAEAWTEEVAPPPDHPVWKEIRPMSEIAVALAWRSLCRQAWSGSSPALEKSKSTAYLCTRNLAVILTRAGCGIEVSRPVFRQAAWLAPFDPALRLFEGRALFWAGHEEAAAESLEGVFADGLPSDRRGLLWRLLGQVRSGPQETRRLAHHRFLDVAAGAGADELRRLMRFSLEAQPSLKETDDRPHP